MINEHLFLFSRTIEKLKECERGMCSPNTLRNQEKKQAIELVKLCKEIADKHRNYLEMR